MLQPMAGFVTELATENAFGDSHLLKKNSIKPTWFNAFGILFHNIIVDITSIFISKGNHQGTSFKGSYTSEREILQRSGPGSLEDYRC